VQLRGARRQLAVEQVADRGEDGGAGLGGFVLGRCDLGGVWGVEGGEVGLELEGLVVRLGLGLGLGGERGLLLLLLGEGEGGGGG
jgi:hypothetical protein